MVIIHMIHIILFLKLDNFMTLNTKSMFGTYYKLFNSKYTHYPHSLHSIILNLIHYVHYLCSIILRLIHYIISSNINFKESSPFSPIISPFYLEQAKSSFTRIIQTTKKKYPYMSFSLFPQHQSFERTTHNWRQSIQVGPTSSRCQEVHKIRERHISQRCLRMVN